MSAAETFSGGANWYVVRTHAHSERKALEHLRRQGFTAYLPQYLKQRRHARKVEKVAAPLFPRYLFVSFDAARERWRSILSTIGIADLINQGGTPLPVPDGVIDSIRAREDDVGLVEMKVEAPFAAGESVQITGGPMSSHVGWYEGLTDQERVIVLLDMLGRKLRIEVPQANVRAYI